MEILFSETINTEKLKISDINSSNTNITIIPYFNPFSEKIINLTKYNLTW